MNVEAKMYITATQTDDHKTLIEIKGQNLRRLDICNSIENVIRVLQEQYPLEFHIAVMSLNHNRSQHI